MINKHKKFDTVKWVREIRDKYYETHKNLKGSNYIKAIKDEIVSDEKKTFPVRRRLKKKVLQ